MHLTDTENKGLVALSIKNWWFFWGGVYTPSLLTEAELMEEGPHRTPRLTLGRLNQDVIDLLKRSLLSCWALFKSEEMDTICHFLLPFTTW